MSHGGVDELERMRCERGADIARGIGLDEDAATAISQLFEHWDGNGHPGEHAGEEISLLARMACLSQTMEVFWQQGGAAAACDVARARRGTWFDPALVDAVDQLERDVCFWASLEMPDVQAVEPADRVLRADDAGLDRVAEAFAGIVDAKSPYTARHCEGVAEIADGIAATMGLDDATRRLLRRAALLHDLGKLGVSNRILDKPGPLTDGEWSAVRRHPRLSMVILRAVPALAAVARLSATHHERLDGSGYPYGLTAERAQAPRPRAAGRRRDRRAHGRAPVPQGPVARRGPGHHALRRRQAPGRRRLRGRRVLAAPPTLAAARRRLMDIRLSEIVAALSHALDVTEGQPMGHAERSCLIGLRLADATDLEPERRSSLFYALLLKDAGCSTTSATTAEVFGSDELHVKREGRLVDPMRPAQSLRYLSRTIAPGAPLRTRARHLRALVAMGVDGARQLGADALRRAPEIASRDRPTSLRPSSSLMPYIERH